jgi:glycosyltransferase involved in cell wall biosynthesis
MGNTAAAVSGRETPRISAVIPAYNPQQYLLEAIASVEGQTYPNWECIVVDDGSDDPASLAILRSIEARADPRIRVVHQENRGLAGARNTGFRESAGRYAVPLDADDLLEPDMMATCRKALEEQSDSGFAYFDYHVFGDASYLEQPGEYDVYRLLNENFMPYCCFVPKRVWEAVGGYDEWHRWGYEDWSFYLNLAKHGHYGRYVRQPLFRYRTHGRGLHYIGLERHESNWAHMEQVHPELLSREGRLETKRKWAPSICVVAAGEAPNLANQTLQDYQLLLNVSEQEALEHSNAPAFLWVSGGGRLRPQTLEECVWALQSADWVSWKDTGDAPPPSLASSAGPLGVSRAMFEAPEPKPSGEVRRLSWRCRSSAPAVFSPPPENPPSAPLRSEPPGASGFFGTLHRHLYNAEALSAEAWLKHPLRSAARLIPLRVKERINRAAGRPVFDLSFYLRFQPRSALIAGGLVERVDYITPPPDAGKARIALVTPHLGVGGAETVLLEFARQIDRSRWEVLLIATQSRDRRLLADWLDAADYVYDLEGLVPLERAPGAIYSMALNWELDALVLQNSLAAYGALPAIKEKRPAMRVADVLHAVDEDWDFFSATLDVASAIDKRIVISEAGRERLVEMQTPKEAIRLVPNGVDLRRFDPSLYDGNAVRRDWRAPRAAGVVAFVGRLDRVKRPLLLADVAREIERLETGREVMFIVAGDGPEHEPLVSRIGAIGVADRFRLLGHVDEPEEVYAGADLLIVPSEAEGVPLAMLEALAMQVPVIACRAGAIEEALPQDCGELVEPGSDEAVRLAEAIVELLGDPERLRAMGEAGRAFVERQHTIDRAREGYRAVLKELAPSADAVSRRE